MKFEIITKDPLYVLSSTKPIVEDLKFVAFDFSKLEELSNKIKNKIDDGLEDINTSFGVTGSYEDDMQLVFLEDVVNFCFWAEKGKEKWQVEWDGQKVNGGWYGLVACFKRALAEKVPILNANYLSSLTDEQARQLFRSSNEVDIPLLKERANNLREAGRVLLDKHNGEFINVVNQVNNNAIELVKLIYKDFSSFRDIADLEGQDIYFLKRAQICASDVNYIYKHKYSKELSNINELTAFADYKLPQMLRTFRLLKYNDELTQKIDNYILIPVNSREEVEIRATTVWGIELIRQKLGNYTTAQVDNALWLMSQDKELQSQSKPYHRTYTIYY